MTLNIYLMRIVYNIPGFKGVFSSDTIPKVTFTRLTPVTSIIINLSKSSEKGTHFIALIFKNAKINYFDSFGQVCTNENIIIYIFISGIL